MKNDRNGADKGKSSRWHFEITVYQDRFVVAYSGITLLYLLIGTMIFIFPLFNPSSSGSVSFRFNLLYVPLVYHAAVTLAVIFFAMRARFALKFYRRAVKSFIGVLLISSLLTFLARHGLAGSIFITIALIAVFSPYLAVILYGLKYMKRRDVLDSFERSTVEYRVT